MSAYLRFITKKYIRKNHFRRNGKFAYPIVCYLDDYITDYIILDGHYELNELNFLAEEIFPKLKQRGLCIDIGAHIGNHSLFFSHYFDQVIAFEPHPKTFQLLKLNASITNNVVPIHKGCSNRYHKPTAIEPKRNSGGTSIQYETIDSRSSNNVEIKVEPLDEMEILKNVDSIDFIKVDVEDHEAECFLGAKDLLEQHSPVIACEIRANTIDNGMSPATLFLNQVGYKYMYELSYQKRGRGMKIFESFRKMRLLTYGLLTNKHLKQQIYLIPVEKLSHVNHDMVIFSKDPLLT